MYTRLSVTHTHVHTKRVRKVGVGEGEETEGRLGGVGLSISERGKIAERQSYTSGWSNSSFACDPQPNDQSVQAVVAKIDKKATNFSCHG